MWNAGWEHSSLISTFVQDGYCVNILKLQVTQLCVSLNLHVHSILIFTTLHVFIANKRSSKYSRTQMEVLGKGNY